MNSTTYKTTTLNTYTTTYHHDFDLEFIASNTTHYIWMMRRTPVIHIVFLPCNLCIFKKYYPPPCLVVLFYVFFKYPIPQINIFFLFKNVHCEKFISSYSPSILKLFSLPIFTITKFEIYRYLKDFITNLGVFWMMLDLEKTWISRHAPLKYYHEKKTIFCMITMITSYT